MKRRISGWSAVAICAMALAAEGATTTLLSDGFEEDPVIGNGLTNLTQWTATRGSVDVVAAGRFGVTGRGRFIDLDGATNLAARLESKEDFALSPGTYTLSFDVGGSMRTFPGTNPNTMTVSLGDVFSTTITKNFNDPFVTESFPITVTSATTGRLVFDHAGGDNVGLLLDNVLLTQGSSAGPVPIPLPAAVWTGMGTLGVIALVGGVRRRRVRG
jgi:hypothetical protein